MTRALRRAAPLALLVSLAPAAAPGTARAGDLTVFAARSTPDDVWRAGFGAAISASFLGLVTVEGEAARLSGEVSEADMTSFSLGGFLSPPIGSLVPYGGLAVGVYRQSLGAIDQTDAMTALVLGLKLNLGRVFVLKGEYRSLNLPSDALIEIDNRFSVGAGIQF